MLGWRDPEANSADTENDPVVAEARQSPRYSRQLDVNIDGLEIRTTNIAAGGVQLCCPQMRYHGFQRAEKDGKTRLRIRLPDTRNWLNVTGMVRYVNPSDDDYLIGFQITDIDSESAKQWAAYIGAVASFRLDA